jgi:mono/diheme cytochrome c family protein
MLLFTALLFNFNDNRAAVSPRGVVVLSGQSVSESTPQQTKPETGKELYQKYCLTCHQNDGGGVPYTFPSLIKSEWVNGDKTRLIRVVLNGLEGDITVGEDTFSAVMPKLNNLTDIQIATVLTFLRQNFENNSAAINPAEVKALRATSKTK